MAGPLAIPGSSLDRSQQPSAWVTASPQAGLAATALPVAPLHPLTLNQASGGAPCTSWPKRPDGTAPGRQPFVTTEYARRALHRSLPWPLLLCAAAQAAICPPPTQAQAYRHALAQDAVLSPVPRDSEFHALPAKHAGRPGHWLHHSGSGPLHGAAAWRPCGAQPATPRWQTTGAWEDGQVLRLQRPGAAPTRVEGRDLPPRVAGRRERMARPAGTRWYGPLAVDRRKHPRRQARRPAPAMAVGATAHRQPAEVAALRQPAMQPMPAPPASDRITQARFTRAGRRRHTANRT